MSQHIMQVYIFSRCSILELFVYFVGISDRINKFILLVIHMLGMDIQLYVAPTEMFIIFSSTHIFVSYTLIKLEYIFLNIIL